MAAQEEQRQAVVAIRSWILSLVEPSGGRNVLLFSPPASLLTTDLVDHSARCDRDEPALRTLRDAVARPGCDRLHQCVLDSVLTGIELPESPQQRAEHSGS